MSGAGWVRVLVTVPAALVAQANAVAQGLDFDAGGVFTFDVPLRPKGGGEVTDFGAYTLMRPHTADQVEGQLLPEFPGARFYSMASGWTISSALGDAGLELAGGA